MPQNRSKYTVIRDTREQVGHGWSFGPSDDCVGTVVQGLKSGDYSLIGYEDKFCIERKGSVVEFVGNITQKENWARFKRELERLDEMPFACVLLEFHFADIQCYPQTAWIPESIKRRIKVRPPFLLKRLQEIDMAFRTKFHFVGNRGKEWASSLFKRAVEKWPEPQIAK